MNSTNSDELKTRVMRRVHFIWWARRIYHSLTLKVFLLGASMGSATFYFSLPNVLNNMPSSADVASFFRFFEVAFLNTRNSVQLISLFIMVVFVWLVSDIIRNIREVRFEGERLHS